MENHHWTLEIQHWKRKNQHGTMEKTTLDNDKPTLDKRTLHNGKPIWDHGKTNIQQ